MASVQDCNFFTVAEIARRLGVSTRAVYAAIDRGELKAAVINGRGDFRIREDWFASFIEARSIPGNTQFHPAVSTK